MSKIIKVGVTEARITARNIHSEQHMLFEVDYLCGGDEVDFERLSVRKGWNDHTVQAYVNVRLELMNHIKLSD